MHALSAKCISHVKPELCMGSTMSATNEYWKLCTQGLVWWARRPTNYHFLPSIRRSLTMEVMLPITPLNHHCSTPPKVAVETPPVTLVLVV